MKLIRFSLFIICIFFVQYTYSQIIPNQLSGLQAWFIADSINKPNGSSVDTFKTVNNEFIYVTQSTPAYCPTKNTNVLNGKSVVRFDGTNDYLDGGDILDIGANGQTTFVVGKTNAGAGTFYAKSYAGGQPKRYSLMYDASNLLYLFHANIVLNINGNNNINSFELLSTNSNITVGKIILYQNSIKKNQGTITNNYIMGSPYNFLIGAYNNTTGTVPPIAGYYLNGDIAEIIIFNRSLSQLERQEIENYLRDKYFPGTSRPQFSIGPDINETYSLAPITLTVPPQAYYQTYEWNTGETTSSIDVDSSGLYTVKVTDDWGYEYYDTIQVTKPSINQIQSQTICDGNTLIWDSGLSGAYTYTWSTGASTQSIPITTAGNYSVSIKDSFNNTINSNIVAITVDDFSTAASLGPDTSLCQGNKIELQSRKAQAILYLWNTGVTTPEITFNTAGTYNVRATNSIGCHAYDTITVGLKGVAPTVDFSTVNSCFGDNTQLTDESFTTDGTTITNITWYFSDDTLTGNVVNHTFSSTGNQPIKVIAETNLNCFGVLETIVPIYPNPTINFVPPKSCMYSNTNFKTTSTITTGTINSYDWNIDGQDFSGDSVEFIFNAVGNYTVSLTGTSNQGCSSTFSKVISIREAPQINFLTSNVCASEPIFFFDKTTYPAYNTVVDGNWIFDGTALPYYSTIGKTFSDTNIHVVTLSVKTNNGCLVSQTKNIKINPTPVASLPPLFGCKNKNMEITTNSNTYGYSINRYEWDINSDLFSIANPIVEFADTGSYPISLIIITEHGCTDSITGNIIIEEQPIANFSFSPEFGAVPIDINFTNESEKADHYLWNFELTGTSTEENPTYTYTDKNNSFARLYAYSTHSCVDSVIKFIPIQLADQNLEILNFQIIPTGNGYATYEVQVLNTGNTGIRLIDFVIENPQFPEISETWTGNLPVDEVLNYTFVAKTKIQDDNEIPYACIKAQLRAAHDYTVYFTDTDCKDFTGKFDIYRLAPNPAETHTTIKFSTKQVGPVTITIFDENGKTMMVENYTEVNAGFHSRTLDVSLLSTGTYICEIKQNAQKARMNFMVR